MVGDLRQKRVFNFLLTGLFLITGIAMAGVGGTLATQPAAVPDQTQNYVETLVSQCADTADGQRFDSEVIGENVVIRSRRDDDPYALIARSSFVIAECEGLTLRRYCMGEDCEEDFLNFSMRYEEASNE